LRSRKAFGNVGIVLGFSVWISHLALLLAVQSAPFELGRPVPALTLPSITDGKPMSVADFRGRKVMLHVWASW